MFFQPHQQKDKDMNYFQHYLNLTIIHSYILYMKGVAWIVMEEMV